MKNFDIEESIDILEEIGFQVLVVDEGHPLPTEPKDYEIFTPTCLVCLKEIATPSEANMESFRLGISMHIICMEMVDRFHTAWYQAFGIEYGK